MLAALKAYTEQGQDIPDQLYKSLTLASHVDLNNSMARLEEQVSCLEKTGSVLAHDNKDEIDRLRSRNNMSDFITAIMIGLATFFGMKN